MLPALVAAAPCNGCNPDSAHLLSWCWITSYNDANSGFKPYSIHDTQPQAAVDAACQAFAAGHGLEVASACAMNSPPVPYTFSGGPWASIGYSATFIDPRTGRVYGGSRGGPECGCSDALNGNNVGVGADASCYCKNGLQWDTQKNACVKNTCPIPDLPNITDPIVQTFEDDPDHSDTEHLTSRMKTALDCLETAVQNAGGAYSVGSAYRPPAYQAHLQAVWNKWRELKVSDNPDCAARRTSITDHKIRHKLRRRPVDSSYHSLGEAFDMTISGLPDWQVENLSVECHVYIPDPVGDPVHFLYTDRAGN